MRPCLQVHLQKTGHAPAAPASLLNLPTAGGGAGSERPCASASTSSSGSASGGGGGGGAASRPAEYSKLVRGQDVWLSGGGERTRRSILRCIQCGESFRSLPELTVHMVHTRHYTNIVGAAAPPPVAPAHAAGGHVTSGGGGGGHVASELPVVGSTHGRSKQRHQQSHHGSATGSGHAVKTDAGKSPTNVTSRDSLVKSAAAASLGNRVMTSSWSPCRLEDDDVGKRREYDEYDVTRDVTPRRSTSHSPASLPETETDRLSAGTWSFR